MNTSSPRHPQPVSARRDGILVEFWQMPSGNDEADAEQACAVYLDTRGWRDEVRASASARMERMERVIKTLYALCIHYLRNGEAHPYDLTVPSFIAGLFVRTVYLDDVDQEWTPLSGATAFTNILLLTPREMRRFFLADGALRLRVFMREGDTPACWWCEWLRLDGHAVVERFEVGAGDEVRAAIMERPTTSPAVPTPAAAEPAFDEQAWQQQMIALKQRYQRDARVRG